MFKKKRQLINSTNLNRLLRTPIYPYTDGQFRAAYLILDYSPVYRSFQTVGKAITLRHPLLPCIDVCYKGYKSGGTMLCVDRKIWKNDL